MPGSQFHVLKVSKVLEEITCVKAFLLWSGCAGVGGGGGCGGQKDIYSGHDLQHDIQRLLADNQMGSKCSFGLSRSFCAPLGGENDIA